MKRYIHDKEEENDIILCHANVRGKKIKVGSGKQPFSFYFSGKNSNHGIRVKPIFNPDKMLASKAGTLKLCDDWEYTPGEDDKDVSSKQVEDMKGFFREYLVLFCAVWEEQLDDPSLQDYFEGEISLHELIQQLSFYEDYKEDLDQISDVDSLETYCFKNGLVNLYGNRY